MDDIQKFMELKKVINELSNKKIRLEERLNNEKTRLKKLLEEIISKGYDPKNLTEIRKQKEEELKTMMGNLEKGIQEAQEKLNLIEI